MVLVEARKPLEEHCSEIPEPGVGQVLLKVLACGVCRTDLHVVDGELVTPKLPLIPGHEVVGNVADVGQGVDRFSKGQRVGVPWLGHTCGQCRYCRAGRENLCDAARFTGYTLDGGYADYIVADQRFCFPLPGNYSDAHAAPLLCAGLIGHRSLMMAGEGEKLGIYGFGAAAHIIAQVAVNQGRRVFAFTRPGDEAAQGFARGLGVVWAGDSSQTAPERLDAAIIFAPVGALIPTALRAVCKGGSVVCAGIHMSDIPTFPYEILWGERKLLSVANLTRRDGDEFFRLAASLDIRTDVHVYPLAGANQALDDLRRGRFQGAAVLVP